MRVYIRDIMDLTTYYSVVNKTWIGGFSKITVQAAAGDPQNLVYSESLPQC